jgi:O-antigen ligase
VKPQPKRPAPVKSERLPVTFAGLFGTFLGLSVLKFGNPPLFEHLVTEPHDIYEFSLGYPWPISWGYRLLFVVTVFGVLAARPKLGVARWFAALPLAWLAWQVLANFHSLDSKLSIPTLVHFAACLVCFYLGLFSLSWVRPLWIFWVGILAGFLLMLAVGWQQHFGGLAETRNYFHNYVFPTMKDIPPEYLKKMSSDRIWATLFYPNSLAGALLLLLPPILGFIATARERFTLAARSFLASSIGIAGLACLYWSGSKGGWLLMLLLGLLTLLRFPIPRILKVGLLSLVLVAGLAGFFWKYSAFFKKGATSVGARFDYWGAAIQTTRENPILGTGPATFAIPYAKIKRPESEMSRIVHNDYLEQASDSGVPGCVMYCVFMVAGLYWAYPKKEHLQTVNRNTAHASAKSNRDAPDPLASSAPASEAVQNWRPFTIWLGVLGWALQGLFEFGLYIPALAWPAFALLGLLLGKSRRLCGES